MSIDLQRAVGRNTQPLGSFLPFSSAKAVLEFGDQRWLRSGVVDTDLTDYVDLKDAGLLNMVTDRTGMSISNNVLQPGEFLIDRVMLESGEIVYLTSAKQLMILPAEGFEAFVRPINLAKMT